MPTSIWRFMRSMQREVGSRAKASLLSRLKRKPSATKPAW